MLRSRSLSILSIMLVVSLPLGFSGAAAAQGARTPIAPGTYGAEMFDSLVALENLAGSLPEVPAPDQDYSLEEGVPEARIYIEAARSALILVEDARARGLAPERLHSDPAMVQIARDMMAFANHPQAKLSDNQEFFELLLLLPAAPDIQTNPPLAGSDEARLEAVVTRSWLLMQVGREAEALAAFENSGFDLMQLAREGRLGGVINWTTLLIDAGRSDEALAARILWLEAGKKSDEPFLRKFKANAVLGLMREEGLHSRAAEFAQEVIDNQIVIDTRDVENFGFLRSDSLVASGQLDLAETYLNTLIDRTKLDDYRGEVALLIRVMTERQDYASATRLLAEFESARNIGVLESGSTVDLMRLEVERLMLRSNGSDSYNSERLPVLARLLRNIAIRGYNGRALLTNARSLYAEAAGADGEQAARQIETDTTWQRDVSKFGQQRLATYTIREAVETGAGAGSFSPYPDSLLFQRLDRDLALPGETVLERKIKAEALAMSARFEAIDGMWNRAFAKEAEAIALGAEPGERTFNACPPLQLVYRTRFQDRDVPSQDPDCQIPLSDQRYNELAMPLIETALRFGDDPSAALDLIEPLLDRADRRGPSLAEVRTGTNSELARVKTGRQQIFPLYADLVSRSPNQAGDGPITNRVFRGLQWAMLGDAAEGINRAAAEKIAARSDAAIVPLLREYHALADDAGAMPQIQVRSIDQTAEERRLDLAEGEKLRRTEMSRDERMSEIRSRIELVIPNYFDLIEPTPLSIAETQERLGPDEALVLLYPSGKQTHVIAIDADGADWITSQLGQTGLDRIVMRLMWDLGAKLDIPDDLNQRWIEDGGGGYPFARTPAHELYEALLAPVERRLSGKKRLYVSAGGSLSQLPFGVMVTQAPQGSDGDPVALRETAWLADRHAVINLPSIASLRLLSSDAEESSGTISGELLAGFGNPVLLGEPADRGLSQRGRRYANSRSADIEEMRGLPPIEQLRSLARLPGSGRELTEIRQTLGAPAEAIRTGAAATETAFRQADLSRTSIIALATHGLMPGELPGFAEAGLVLTPPVNEQPMDDGYLSSSEIAALQLDADWVLLSACNTAVGDNTGMSSLTDAFFFAGAKSVLASHWPVNDDAAARLTAVAIKLRRDDPSLSRAEAMQQSVRAVRADVSHDGKGPDGEPRQSWAHPGVWAPFSVFGDVSEAP